METPEVKTRTIPAMQLGFVCASLPGHIQDSRNAGHELRPNKHGFEIWQPEQVVEVK